MFGRTKASSVEDEQQHLNAALRYEVDNMSKKPKPATSSKKKVVRSVKRKLPLPVKQWALVGDSGAFKRYLNNDAVIICNLKKTAEWIASDTYTPIRVEIKPCK